MSVVIFPLQLGCGSATALPCTQEHEARREGRSPAPAPAGGQEHTGTGDTLHSGPALARPGSLPQQGRPGVLEDCCQVPGLLPISVRHPASPCTHRYEAPPSRTSTYFVSVQGTCSWALRDVAPCNAAPPDVKNK